MFCKNSSSFFNSCFAKKCRLRCDWNFTFNSFSLVMEWSPNHDLALAREVLLLESYRHKARTVVWVVRGKVWQTIADNLNSHVTLKFLVTKKSVREHLKLLLDKYRARTQNECRDRGVERWNRAGQTLQEINEKWEAANSAMHSVSSRSNLSDSSYSDSKFFERLHS